MHAESVSIGPDLLLHGLKILVVEDDYMVADVITAALSNHGAEVIGPAPSTAEALRLIRDQPLSGALLDVNLAGEFCFPLATALDKRHVPYLFLTGYTDFAIVPGEFSEVPRMAKPFSIRGLVQCAARHLHVSRSPNRVVSSSSQS